MAVLEPSDVRLVRSDQDSVGRDGEAGGRRPGDARDLFPPSVLGSAPEGAASDEAPRGDLVTGQRDDLTARQVRVIRGGPGLIPDRARREGQETTVSTSENLLGGDDAHGCSS